MDAQNLKIKTFDSINLNAGIVCINSCTQFFAVGCIDDSIRVWRNKLTPFQKQPVIEHNEQISGLVDIAFTKNCTHMATLSLDSSLKIWDLNTNFITIFDVPMLSAWKIAFIGDTLITCGDIGKLFYYDIFSKETIKRINLDDSTYLTAIDTLELQKKIAVGNVNGEVYLFSYEGKQDIVNISNHHKTIRSIKFSNDKQKIFLSSDDTMISMTDINKLKRQASFQGHLQKVTCVKTHPLNQNIIYSCSHDKTIRIWDIRSKNQVHKHTSNGPLWSIQSAGNHIFAGGELGVLQIYSVQ